MPLSLELPPEVHKQINAGVDLARAQAEALTPHVEAGYQLVRTQLAPHVENAVRQIAPTVELARTQLEKTVLPALITAYEQAAEVSEPVRREALRRAEAALSALKGEAVVAQRARRWPLVAAALAAGAAAGAAAGSVLGREPAYPAPVPPVAPVPTAVTTPAEPEQADQPAPTSARKTTSSRSRSRRSDAGS